MEYSAVMVIGIGRWIIGNSRYRGLEDVQMG